MNLSSLCIFPLAGKADKPGLEKKPSPGTKSEKDVKGPAKDDKAKKPVPAKKGLYSANFP